MPKRSGKRPENSPIPGAVSLLRGQLPLERETVWFVLMSALDVLMTYLLIRQPGFTEGNPIAGYFLNHWGVKGMVYFKFFMVAFVAVIAQISNHRPKAGKPRPPIARVRHGCRRRSRGLQSDVVPPPYRGLRLEIGNLPVDSG